MAEGDDASVSALTVLTMCLDTVIVTIVIVVNKSSLMYVIFLNYPVIFRRAWRPLGQGSKLQCWSAITTMTELLSPVGFAMCNYFIVIFINAHFKGLMWDVTWDTDFTDFHINCDMHYFRAGPIAISNDNGESPADVEGQSICNGVIRQLVH